MRERRGGRKKVERDVEKREDMGWLDALLCVTMLSLGRSLSMLTLE
jgi:hypothetical protein